MIKSLIRGFRSRSFTLANWLSSQRACEAYRHSADPLGELGPLVKTVLSVDITSDITSNELVGDTLELFLLVISLVILVT